MQHRAVPYLLDRRLHLQSPPRSRGRRPARSPGCRRGAFESVDLSVRDPAAILARIAVVVAILTATDLAIAAGEESDRTATGRVGRQWVDDGVFNSIDALVIGGTVASLCAAVLWWAKAR